MGDNSRPPKAYEYEIIKKNYNRPIANRQESAFRERTQHSDNDQLKDLFMDRNSKEENDYKDNIHQKDAEYAVLLSELWSKYKSNNVHGTNDDNAQGVVKLYKDKIVKKRYPNNWGPIAFKRKRSSDLDREPLVANDNEDSKENVEEVPGPVNPNYNSYEVSEGEDDDDKDDMREEYAIAFQPLDDDSLSDLADEDQYAYDSIEKRFPVTKRSSGPYNFNTQKKRFVTEQTKHDNAKLFRSSSGTDPKIMRDLSKIFGDTEHDIIKSPVKRSSDNMESFHEPKPPTLTVSHNHTHDMHNTTVHENTDHEEHGPNIHPPGISGKEVAHEHIHNEDDPEHDHNHNDYSNHAHDEDHDHEHKQTEKPIKIRKKSIDWSDYFGIDKRLKKSVSFVNNLNEDRLKKQYFDTFNKEVIYPLNSFRKHNYVKRNYVQVKPMTGSEIPMNQAQALGIRNEKRSSESDSESKLDNIDKKLKNMEGLIVDEALHYSNIGEELDSKEEQEMKEKLLSRLAAAYSLEKMRKALKDFKQSLQMQKASVALHSSPDPTDMKDKRVAIKKEKVMMSNNIPGLNNHEKNNDFEDEQGAGHYLNGKIEEQLSEGYMGGSGRHRTPIMSTGRKNK